MSQAFLCPSCQASLEYEEGGALTVRCQYCQTTVIVPPELRPTMRRRADGPGLVDLAEITRLLLAGKKIEAIKLISEVSGLSLKEAKDVIDLVIAADGKLIAYAFQPPDTLYWLDGEGNILQTVSAILSGQTESPELTARVAVDGLGNVYLLGEGFTPLIFKYDASGKFITRIGSKGNEPGQLRSPRALAIDNQGWLYVVDSDGIDVFAGDGRYLDTIPLRGVAFDMTFNDRNELFLMERNGNRVVQMALQAGAQGK